MHKNTLRNVIPIAVLAVMLLSACGTTATPDPTEMAAPIYTAAAQTIEAKMALITPTNKPIETILPSMTPDASATATVTETPSPVTPSPTSLTENYCDNSKFIKDVTIPDNTIMSPGQAFDKTWTFQNIGTCTWTESYIIIFSYGDLMNGATRFIAQTVAPQQMADVTVKLTAPIKVGTYTGFWRLANSRGDPFGQVSSVVIIVSEGGTATATPANSATPGATQTPTPTETPKP